MDPSKLTSYIGIVEQTNTPDGLGEMVSVWTTVINTYAHQTSRPGREFYQSAKVTNEQHDYFLIRDRPGITPQMRVVTSDLDHYEIVDILKSDRRGESLQLVCKRLH